jgi:hypothetical protein
MFRVAAVRSFRRVLVAAALAALGACGDQAPTEPIKPGAERSLDGLFSWTPRLVTCATDETRSTSAVVGPLGGVIALGGTSVSIPADALLQSTTVELTIPASRYVEIRLRANNQEHFQFALPIAVTIGYSRCDRLDVLFRPLTAWYIDVDTKEPLHPMVGVDNKITRSVTFLTNHFSGYAIAF